MNKTLDQVLSDAASEFPGSYMEFSDSANGERGAGFRRDHAVSDAMEGKSFSFSSLGQSDLEAASKALEAARRREAEADRHGSLNHDFGCVVFRPLAA